MKLPTNPTTRTLIALSLCALAVAAAAHSVHRYWEEQAEIASWPKSRRGHVPPAPTPSPTDATPTSLSPRPSDSLEVDRFLRIIPRTRGVVTEEELILLAQTLPKLRQEWKPTHAVMLLETAMRSPELAPVLFPFLEKMTGQKLGDSQMDWLPWIWREIPDVHPDYLEFKGKLYSQIDSEFMRYFEGHPEARIRADEIVWGGVKIEGIPRLSHPPALPASEATWMGDDDIVFGLKINGESRAYPRRIYAYHELIQDQLGGVEIVTPYCTMCESVNVYETQLNGVSYDLRTSGFIYRSNKLMYDVATHSMWSSVAGEPVVGSLVKQKLKLKRHPVQTATWKAWREAHPDTTVISTDTGFQRDYREGAAYAEFHQSSRLWYPVPKADDRLPEKHLVLAIPSDDPGRLPLAIDTDHLHEHPVYVARNGGHSSLVLTDPDTGSRVYAIPEIEFSESIANQTVTDSTGRIWTITDEALTSPEAEKCPRIPAHEIYWLPWVNHQPTTVLLPE